MLSTVSEGQRQAEHLIWMGQLYLSSVQLTLFLLAPHVEGQVSMQMQDPVNTLVMLKGRLLGMATWL